MVDSNAFIQAWLFFGLVEVTFQCKVPVRDFVRNRESPGPRFITTSKLRDYMNSSRSRMEIYSMPEKRAAIEALRAASRVAHKVLEQLPLTRDGTEITGMNTFLALHFSICLLLDVSVSIITSGLSGIVFKYFRPPVKLLERQMLSESWCPSTTFILNQTPNPSNMAYAYSLGTSRTIQDHSRCTLGRCKANQTKKPMQPAHLESSCTCELIGPPMDAMISILRRRLYPHT